MREGDTEAWLYDQAMDCLFKEYDYGLTKFGPYRSLHEAAAIIREEHDEFWEEVKANDVPRAAEEVLQLAATAIRAYVEFGLAQKP